MGNPDQEEGGSIHKARKQNRCPAEASINFFSTYVRWVQDMLQDAEVPFRIFGWFYLVLGSAIVFGVAHVVAYFFTVE